MRSAVWLLSPLALLAVAGEGAAQVLVVPPAGPPTILVGPGGGVMYQRRFVGNVYLGGGWGLGPYGASSSRVTITYYFPRPIIVSPTPEVDVSGVDLDTVPPPWRPKELKQPAPPRLVKPAPKLKPKQPALPKPPPRPEDVEAASALLRVEGQKAFSEGEYGLAAQRFRRAAVVDRKNARARFLLAQALFALGKYQSAVGAIYEGMDLDPNWPLNPFRPRLDLYKGNEAAFTEQFKELSAALDRSPDNRYLLFLYAYQLWFDGRHAEALAAFQRARAVSVDTTYIDRFLRAAKGGAVAAR
jgi:hypothetical protein